MNLDRYSKIVFFGGAGTSTESGIPDFRSAKGLYSRVPEELLSHGHLIRHPEEFFGFCKASLYHPDAEPVEGHRVLVELEKQGRLLGVITQNIDGLHQKAGNTNVLELHGTMKKNYCMKCYQSYSMEWMMEQPGVPKCESCSGMVRPDVTLYGEMLDQGVLHAAIALLEKADLLIMSGSSFIVQPAAGLVHLSPAKKILINLGSTPMDHQVDEHLACGFSEGMRKLFPLTS